MTDQTTSSRRVLPVRTVARVDTATGGAPRGGGLAGDAPANGAGGGPGGGGGGARRRGGGRP
ncbi:hypothetical protein, partial [Frankia sp. AgB1.8]|uniref:hypothetical protein n=1 Tax=Frankia sp. AgB1.8 TaxID=2792839 RepID=UPI001EE45AB6